MDSVLAFIGTVVTSALLVDDYNRRNDFESFKRTGKAGNNQLFVGEVKAQEPPLLTTAFVPNGYVEKLVAVTRVTFVQSAHTYISDYKIADGLSMPIPITDYTWTKQMKDPYWGKDIKLLTSTGELSLFMPKNVKIEWDKTGVITTGNLKMVDKLLYDSRMRYIFGKLYDNKLNAQFIGSEEYVNRKVRSDYFLINNWFTGILGLGFGLSLSYLAVPITKSKQKRFRL